jgi:hypothetical protein
MAVIVTSGLVTVVTIGYALVFPAFIKLVHVGIEPRPNYSIWRHKKRFYLFEAAYLLADREPIANMSFMTGDASAWYALLYEAIRENELPNVRQPIDSNFTYVGDGYKPHSETLIEAGELKKFCEKRGRNPEFLP